MFEFGKRKEVAMSSEPPKEPTEQKTTTYGAARPPRKEVDLFPPLANKPPAVAPVTSHGGTTRLNTQISMFQPASFEEAVEIVGALRGRAATTISLEKMRKLDAGRLVDFVCGASAALDGSFQKLTEHVFVFCPANMKIVAAAAAPILTGTRTTIAAGAGIGGPNPLDFLFAAAPSTERSLPGVLRNGLT